MVQWIPSVPRCTFAGIVYSFVGNFRPAALLWVLLLAAGWFPATTAHSGAVTLSYAPPEEAGFDPVALEEAVGLFRMAVARDELRGVVLLVARNGKVVVHEAIGWRDRENGRPMEKDTLIRMASNTKAVVAMAALLLAEEGKLSLEDPVAKHIPAFDKEGFRKITVAQLMANSGGLPRSPIFLRGVADDSNLVLEAERFAKALKMESEAGTKYGYSNAGYNILGGVIEAVSGDRLDHFIDQRIYRPLGMGDSNHHESTADQSRMAKVYVRRGGEWRARWSPGDDPSYPIIRASGGMISTARDFAVFLQCWLNGGAYGNVRLLSPESVRLGLTVQSPDNSYGYGWRIGEDGEFSHGGSDGTFAWGDPRRGIIGLVFTQSPGGDNPRDEFRRKVTEALAAVSD